MTELDKIKEQLSRMQEEISELEKGQTELINELEVKVINAIGSVFGEYSGIEMPEVARVAGVPKVKRRKRRVFPKKMSNEMVLMHLTEEYISTPALRKKLVKLYGTKAVGKSTDMLGQRLSRMVEKGLVEKAPTPEGREMPRPAFWRLTGGLPGLEQFSPYTSPGQKVLNASSSSWQTSVDLKRKTRLTAIQLLQILYRKEKEGIIELKRVSVPVAKEKGLLKKWNAKELSGLTDTVLLSRMKSGLSYKNRAIYK